MRALSCSLLLLALAPALSAAPDPSAASDVLRARLEAADRPTVLVGGEPLAVHPDLFRFYAGRDYAVAWDEHAGDLLPLIEASAGDGLDPGAYHRRRIEAMQEAGNASPDVQADRDLLLTDAFLRLGEHLLRGRVDPTTIYEKWYPARRVRDLAATLETALASGDLGGALDGLRPQHAAYDRLRDALARTRAAAGTDLPIILPARTLEVGHESMRVPLVRQRLALFGEAVPEAPDSLRLVYTDALSEVVRRFQARHGLEASGTLDQPTRHALNRSSDDWAEALILNLERWRWLPDSLGTRHVFVNLPAFRLQVVDDEETTLAMDVVVGKTSWYTPVLTDTMEAVIFHPTWGVPGSIARAETLPRARSRGSEYLSSRGYNVYHRGARVDPATVNWDEAGSHEYYFIQSPGPANPLGTVKFAFPNQRDIYIHDTNQKRLFARAKRAYSHGCIRAAEPRDLAAHLLVQQGWSDADVDGAFARRSTQNVALREPLLVHLVYFTAHAGEGGLAFYDDVYGHDAVLASALGLGE
ncbi:MAG: L,D-transpeptidase family protein [Bacteroidota bacterium]